VTVHPEVCHGLAADATVRTGNAFTAGDTITIDMYGSASHLGGHCAFWYSTDDETFTKIIDIKDCTLSPTFDVTLPVTMPTECETKCTFAFTWVPRVSGACEIYMNCADISVAGAQGGNASPIEINFQTTFIDQAASGYGCIRVDDTTHWTTIFGDLKTEYDSTDTDPNNNNPVVTADPVIEDENTEGCWLNSDLAINLDNEISANGVCGSGANDNRCDDGMCCSEAGYCGPDFDGTGYVDYGNGYYASADAAFAAYCTNPLGDWRLDDCSDTDTDTDVDTTNDPSASPVVSPTVNPTNAEDTDDDSPVASPTANPTVEAQPPTEDASKGASHAPALVSLLLGFVALFA